MKIAFLGDMALGDHPKTIGYGFGSTYPNEIPLSKASRLVPPTVDADIVFGNLEYPLYAWEQGSRTDRTVAGASCRGRTQYAKLLREAGLSVVSLANNHAYQHGDKPFRETLSALKEAGIIACGTPQDFTSEQILVVSGRTVGFLGWSDRPRQYFDEKPPYNELDRESCCRAVAEMKSNVDVVCVSLHWGVEFVEMPGKEDIELARSLIDAGASVVVGHHPHVLREVEEYRGGVIAYSLGNSIGDMLWDARTRETACLAVEFGASGLRSWELHPGQIGEDYFPEYLAGQAKREFIGHLEERYARIRQLARTSSYSELEEKALKRHQKLTALHFARNLPRYDKSVLFDALRHAIVRRIKF